MTMTHEKQHSGDDPSRQDLVEQLESCGQLDALFAPNDAGKVELTGDGGFVPAIVKATLERGLQAELTSHLGYEWSSQDAAKHANSRNGTTPKTMESESRSGRTAKPPTAPPTSPSASTSTGSSSCWGSGSRTPKDWRSVGSP